MLNRIPGPARHPIPQMRSLGPISPGRRLKLGVEAVGRPQAPGLMRGSSRLFASQVKFPATQIPSSDANTLDDYEEGTTTPTVTSTVGTITTASASVVYVKVGRIITWAATVTITTAGTGAGALRFNLPFTNGAVAAGFSGQEYNATALMVGGSIPPSGATCFVYKYDGTTIIASGRILGISGVYVVD